MNSPFSSPRVVIIDDNPDEAMPMIDAFSSLGVPVAKFSGTGPDTLPEEPFKHVRVLILDLHLETSGFDPKYTAGVILRTISPTISSGPCLFYVWTSHGDEDDVNRVKDALDSYNADMEIEQRVSPSAWVVMQKQKFQRPDGKFDAAALIKSVQEEFDKLSPSKTLLEWESQCAEAASAAVDRILSLIFETDMTYGGQWQNLLKTAMEKLARAWAGRNLPSDNSSVGFKEALFSSMAFIHEDSIRNLISGSGNSSNHHLPAKACDAKSMIAALNTLILTTSANGATVPGAVSSMESLTIPDMPFTACHGEDYKQFDKTYRQFVNQIFLSNYGDNKSNIYKLCEPVMIETTPACDFAQGKRKRLRFAPGLLMPEELVDLLPQKAESIRRYGPIMYKGNIYWIVLESLYFFTVLLDSETRLNEPIFRLRSHVQADINAWLASHISRPGHITLDFTGIPIQTP